MDPYPAAAAVTPHPLNSRCLQQHMFSLLETCTSMRALMQIHAQLLVSGFSQKKFLLAKLISFCLASGHVLHARLAFRQVQQPTVVLYNHMIRGVSRCTNTPRDPFLLYNCMTAATDTRPDSFTYSFLLTSCSAPCFSTQGQQLHARTVSGGFSSCVFVQTSLINMYLATGEADAAAANACRVFDQMPHRNTVTWNSMIAAYLRCGDANTALRTFDDMPERNVVSWTTMIAGFANSGRCEQALALFREMQRAQIQPDHVALIAALSACAELGNLKMGRQIHVSLIECDLQQQRLVRLNNALIHMYAKCGVIEEAHRIFQEMSWRSLVTWTSMITGFAIHGRGADALSIFDRMQTEGGARPDEITFIGVLSACSHAGWVDAGRRYFAQMTQVFHIKPRIEHYGCMVDLLSRAGLLDEARELIDAMPFEPNDVVWGAVLGGCRIHKNAEMAGHVAGQLLTELDQPDRAAGYLVLLSNVYAAAKRWDDVGRVREKMVEMGVRKPVGRSWIEVNGAIHAFVAGEQTRDGQAAAAEIYEMVGEMIRRAKMAGHMPDTSQVLLDVEEEEEMESLLHLHSEKLAVAFGLIKSRGATTPIRIVKNLRICRDCHSIMKFVSESFKREIVVRDRKRFHHFTRGSCSCQDYW
ncbi:hypothetical protein ACLOJK_022286 [Asimina triloba]